MMSDGLFSEMMYEFFSSTDTGRIRTNNEDAVLVHEAARLAILADGMGGSQAGEVASGMATALISVRLGTWLLNRGPQASTTEARGAIRASVDRANHGIFQAANTHGEFEGMGTTVVVAVFRDLELLLGHVGDSRAYRWRDGRLARLTRDHSWLQTQIEAGLMSPQEALQSPYKGLITRALGVEPQVELELQTLPVEAGDLFLLCSDGLTDMLDDGALTLLLAQGGDLAELGEQLIRQANERGGNDNISIILVRAGMAPAPADDNDA